MKSWFLFVTIAVNTILVMIQNSGPSPPRAHFMPKNLDDPEYDTLNSSKSNTEVTKSSYCLGKIKLLLRQLSNPSKNHRNLSEVSHCTMSAEGSGVMDTVAIT